MINTLSPSLSIFGARTQKTDITVKQLAEGIAGIVPGAVIDGFGASASVLAHTPKGVFELYRGVYLDQDHGPLTKTLVSVLIPIGVAVGVPIAMLGAFGYGAVAGAYEAGTKGLGQSVKDRIDDVKNVDKMLREGVANLKKANDDLAQQEQNPPAPPTPPAPPAPAPPAPPSHHA